MYRNILVPVDGSSASLAALREILKIAVGRPWVIHLIHVVDLLHWNQEFAAASVGGILLDARRETGQKCLDESKDVISNAGLEFETVMLESHGERISDVVVSYAKQWPADMIVMGTHGRKGVSRLILGSDAAEVVRNAPAPVLLVRAP